MYILIYIYIIHSTFYLNLFIHIYIVLAFTHTNKQLVAHFSYSDEKSNEENVVT